MPASLLKLEIRSNYWLMAGIAVPVGIYMFFRPSDRGDWVVSDWNYLLEWSRHYVKGIEFWNKLGAALLINFGTGFVIGWIAHYLIMITWTLFRRPSSASFFSK